MITLKWYQLRGILNILCLNHSNAEDCNRFFELLDVEQYNTTVNFKRSLLHIVDVNPELAAAVDPLVLAGPSSFAPFCYL